MGLRDPRRFRGLPLNRLGTCQQRTYPLSTVSPFGTWKSPITADLITDNSVSLIEIALDGPDIYWIESHPHEGGRYTIMHRAPDGSTAECTPPDFYARTTVHEYGGGALAVSDGNLYFANFADQHLYRQSPGGRPSILTPRAGYRYADLVVDQERERLISIREDHTAEGEAVNTIVSVSLGGNDNGRILVEGNDFYSSARLSPDGRQLAFLTWNHPNMPWDGCELWMAGVAPSGELHGSHRVAGSATESVFQPEWSPDGTLHYVAETSGWWNLYRWKDGRSEALCPMEAEFGEPQWVFGMSMYGFVSATRILCTYSQQGISQLAWLDTSTRQLSLIPTPYTDFSHLRCGTGYAVLIAGGPSQPASIVRMNTATSDFEVLRQAFAGSVDPRYFSVPEAMAFPNSAGEQSHGFYYPPRNPDFVAPAGDLPPLLVISHGGPTAAAGTSLRYAVQYWTSRGFAVLDVNYGGSSGYGRRYRKRLNGNWGVVDVDDCCSGALYLAEKLMADGRRLAIRGGSAGGYTTLACLTFRNEVFTAGASHYGLAELERFANDTHKFESHYLSSLIGPYPERRDLYLERSPINFTQNLNCPLILFQGDEDKIVPPSQSLMMFEAVRAKELPVAYLLFHGEQHGFRKAENIKRALEAELYFYSKVFGFKPSESMEPVPIENL